MSIYLLGFQSHRHLQGHIATSSFYWWKKNPTCTNTRLFACMGRTTDAPKVSWKTSPNESFCSDQDSKQRSEGPSGWKQETSTTRLGHADTCQNNVPVPWHEVQYYHIQQRTYKTCQGLQHETITAWESKEVKTSIYIQIFKKKKLNNSFQMQIDLSRLWRNK